MAGQTWTLTVRAGAAVERTRFDALDEALERLVESVHEFADQAEHSPPATRLRHYEAADQVVARVEIAGPERRLASRHAGVDVRGDGSTVAYLGRVKRKQVDRRAGEDDVTAVGRALRETTDART